MLQYSKINKFVFLNQKMYILLPKMPYHTSTCEKLQRLSRMLSPVCLTEYSVALIYWLFLEIFLMKVIN